MNLNSRLAEFSDMHMKTSTFYAIGKKKAPYTDMTPLVRKLRDTFGANRLMWASDCPLSGAGRPHLRRLHRRHP